MADDFLGKPRKGCADYFARQGIDSPIHVTKLTFDTNFRGGMFKDEPMADSFGDGYGEPYYPWRQAYGVLLDGRGVFCELHEDGRELGADRLPKIKGGK